MKDRLSEDPHKRIDQARMELLFSYPFFGSLALSMTPTPTDEVQICATDGKKFYYNPEAVLEQSLEELMASICHEILHVALLHTNGHRGNRSGDHDPFLWNIATDAQVNYIIRQQQPGEKALKLLEGTVDGNTIPWDPPLSKPWQTWGAETLYNHLPVKQVEEITIVQCGLMESKTGEGDAENGGPKRMTDAEAQIFAAKVRAAYEQAKRAGKEPGNLEEQIDALRTPQKRWQDELARFVQRVFEDFGYNPPDLRIMALVEEGLIEDMALPSLSEGEELRNIIFGIDTSGSISTDSLIDFCSEAYAIAQIGVELKLVYWDFKVQGIHELTPDPPPTPVGRGGTNVSVFFDEIEAQGWNPEAAVIFTDGETPWPMTRPPYPVVWVINNEKIDPPFGDVIRYQPREERVHA